MLSEDHAFLEAVACVQTGDESIHLHWLNVCCRITDAHTMSSAGHHDFDTARNRSAHIQRARDMDETCTTRCAKQYQTDCRNWASKPCAYKQCRAARHFVSTHEGTLQQPTHINKTRMQTINSCQDACSAHWLNADEAAEDICPNRNMSATQGKSYSSKKQRYKREKLVHASLNYWGCTAACTAAKYAEKTELNQMV